MKGFDFRPLAVACKLLFAPFVHFLEILNVSGRSYHDGRIVKSIDDGGGFRKVWIRTSRKIMAEINVGQPVGLSILLDGRWITRYYTLVALSQSRFISPSFAVLIRKCPTGRMSQFLHEAPDTPISVRIKPAIRRSAFFTRSDCSRAFVSAGSGITPAISYLGTESDPNLVHFHVCTDRSELPKSYTEILDHSEFGQFRSIIWETTKRGRPTFKDLTDAIPDLPWRVVHAAGPSAFIEAIRSGWDSECSDTLPGNLYTEQFSSSSAAVDPGTSDDPVKVTYDFGAKVIVSNSNRMSLLEGAENAGLQLPYGCRMGICHSCTAHLTTGTVVNRNEGRHISAPTVIQTCVSYPIEACEIAVHNGHIRRDRTINRRQDSIERLQDE